MKIVYISFSTIPSRVANSIHTMQMCNALSGLGHEVILLAPDVKEVEKVGDLNAFYGIKHPFEVLKLPYPDFKGRSMVFGMSTRKYLKSIHPDLVLGRSIHGCLMSTELKIPTVFDSHSPVHEATKIRQMLFRRMIRSGHVKKMTVISRALKTIYEKSSIFEKTGFDPRSIKVAPNGSNDYPLEDKVTLPGDPQKVKAGYFGHLYPGRGIEQIIEIAAQLKETDFYIVGGREADIASWKSKVKSKNVYFIGFVPFAEVYKYRNSCDILLAPYQKVVAPGALGGNQSYYMNPIKVIEYMSSKKPIVSSRLPTICELLNDNNAVLLDGADIDSWAEAIIRLSADPSYAAALSSNAYAGFCNRLTWKARAESLIN